MDVPKRCPLSDPVRPHTFSSLDGSLSKECFKCGSDEDRPDFLNFHYYCDVCELVFHHDCEVLIWPGIKHPYHLNHFLSVTFRFSETETHSFSNRTEYNQSFEKIDLLSDNVVKLNHVFESDDGCDWCGEKLGYMFYRCLVCGFCLDISCINNDPPFTITNPKSHHHPLNLFPRQLSVPCSACGLCDQKKEPAYFCLPCNYFVHTNCVDLPRVIKLTRHPHRLSHTPCLPPPAKRSCGVCRRDVDVKNGMYSCNKGCSYAVHSKCATHKDIWDGVDLEGVPEEPEEDIAPFEEVGHNLIKHFTHEHHLRFNEDELDHDGDKECQACCRPVDSGGFYGCTILHCDFFLHATCANFPKKKEHPVHKHPLTLQPATSNRGYTCRSCGRNYTGFSYACLNNSCRDDDGNFTMDVRCASVCEPFEHKGHPHPLFLFSGRDSSSQCGICGKEGKSIYTLNCNDCQFDMCFKCATIPVVIRYKHDEHLLTLSSGEDSSDPYWCEICETQIDPKKWFYTCNECCTTLHIDCVFGDTSYFKLGWRDVSGEIELTFASNKGNCRPVCHRCGVRCLNPGFLKLSDIVYICSIKCISAETI